MTTSHHGTCLWGVSFAKECRPGESICAMIKSLLTSSVKGPRVFGEMTQLLPKS